MINGSLFAFTVEQIVRPFWIWSSSTEEILRSRFGSNLMVVRLVATIQSIVSLTLIALFLLALRRRFKMD